MSETISIIMPFYKKIDEFKTIFPLNLEIIKENKNVKELIIVLDENESEKELISFLKEIQCSKYLFVSIIVNDNDHEWRNPSKAINVGIRSVTSSNCLVLSPESMIEKNLIKDLSCKKNYNNFVIGKLNAGKIRSKKPDLDNIDRRQHYYGSILFSKSHAVNITGYNEVYKRWGYDDDDFRKRLEMSGINKEFVESGIVHYTIEDKNDGVIRDKYNSKLFLRNKKIKVNGDNWGKDFSRKVDLKERNPNKINRPDVMHLSCYYGSNHSIQKIIDNISSHNLNHVNCDLNTNNMKSNINHINFVKPKVLHLHYNSIISPDMTSYLNYTPNAIIQTIHGDQRSNYSKYVDKIVTIYKKTHEDINGSLYIENSINEIYQKINNEPIYDNCVTCFRFKKLNFEVFKKLENINTNIDVFGYKYGTNNNIIFDHYKNVTFHFWSHFTEINISKRKIFLYLIDNPEIGYDMSIMEAANIGIPIVALRQRQDGQKYIIDGYNGFIVDSIDEMVCKVNEILADKKLYDNIFNNSLEHKTTLVNDMPHRYGEIYNSYL